MSISYSAAFGTLKNIRLDSWITQIQFSQSTLQSILAIDLL